MGFSTLTARLAELRAAALLDPTSIASRQQRLDADPEAQAAFDDFARAGSLFSSSGRARFLEASKRLKAATDRLEVTPLPEDYKIDVGERKIKKDTGTNWLLVGVIVGAAVAAPFVIGAIAGAGAGASGAAAAGASSAGAVLPSTTIPLVSSVGHLAVPAAIASQGASAAVYATAGTIAAAAAPAVASVGGAGATVSSVGSTAGGATKALSSLPGLISKIFSPSPAPTMYSPQIPGTGDAGYFAPYGNSYSSQTWILAGLALLAVVAIARN